MSYGSLSDLNVQDELAFASHLADEARIIALEYFRTGAPAECKPSTEFDPVTQADRDIEARLRLLIGKHRPDDAIIGEEQADKLGVSGRTWVIDPIDGTRAFMAGVPTWCVLIALYGAEGPLLSVMDQPFTQERFLGVIGHQAWLDHKNGRTLISTRASAQSVSDAILATTDPSLFDDDEQGVFDQLARDAKIRRYGLDAYGYGALALGGVDLVVESGLKKWDVGALIPVVSGAGGVITNWQGAPAHEGGQIVAAATPQLHDEALSYLQKAAR